MRVDVHHGFAHVFAGNDAFFLGWEVFVCVGEELEYFFDFIFLFAGYVVLLCEFGLARALGAGVAGGCSAPLGRLWSRYA